MPGSDALDPGGTKCLDSLHQAGPAEVERVVVRESAHVDACGFQAFHVLRMHPIVNGLARPEVVADRDASLEVREQRGRHESAEDREAVAPDVRGIDRSRHWAMCLFRELHVARGTVDVELAELGSTPVGQDLVYAPSRHDVSGQTEGYQLLVRINRDFLRAIR
jgi:hypothetical protein